MSHFYGTLQGSSPVNGPGAPKQRPTIARRGADAESGLEVQLRSNEGSVVVQVYEGEAADGGLEDRVTIRFESVRAFSEGGEQGPVVGHNFTLYSGPLAECVYENIYLATQESEQ